MELNIETKTVIPATVLNQGECVGLDGNTAGADEYVYGVCNIVNSATNEPAQIVAKGECWALVDGDDTDVEIEDPLKCDASGHLVKASTTGTLTDTGTAGDSITIEESHIIALEANAGAAALKKVLIK